ncbi:MAG: hypothetical protein K9J17_16275 [Flavobacteriales bacterium]|nr:hypothetical protein [Flavobacteriales bacterium]
MNLKQYLILLLIAASLMACKNNGQNTVASEPAKVVAELPSIKPIIVDNTRKPRSEFDFQLLDASTKGDILSVVVRYSGGCKEHDFNAYFSGAYAKSLPPQAIVELEHLNPDNDPCRSLVKDTFQFDLKPLRYSASEEVIVKFAGDSEKSVRYRYFKDPRTK